MHDDMIRQVEPLIPALRRYAGALMSERAAADDLVQDCLERAISRWHQHRADGNTRTWLFTILHNLAVNRWQQRRRRGPHVELDDAPELALASEHPQEAQHFQQDIMRAIARLPDDQRSVLLLVSVEDLSYAEAASVLDIPVGTVMSRLSRARDRLRQLLDMQQESAQKTGAETRSASALRRVK